MYFVEIWRKNSSIPLIQYNLTLEKAENLYNSAAKGWNLRRIGISGKIIKEEKI